MNSGRSHSIGAGNCVIGNTKICPRVTPNPATPVSFKRSQQLNFWMQVYNLGIDETTKSNEAHGYLPDRRYGEQQRRVRKAVGFKGLGSAQRPVDGGKIASHGWTSARQIQGDDQGK